MEKSKYRIVLDTNVILAFHLSHSMDSPNREIIFLWKQGEFNLLWTEDILYEYIQKLKVFNVEENLIVQFIADFIELAEKVKVQFYHYKYYPEDAKDICFVICAVNGNASHIITYDKHLLDLRKEYQQEFGFEVMKPLVFLKIFKGGH